MKALTRSTWKNFEKLGLFSVQYANTYSTVVDTEYIQWSNVPTDHFQKSLPHLPIPHLEKTCERYLLAQKAILTADQYAKTEKIVKDFQNGIGKELHADLVAKDKRNKHTSYISEPWFDMYLRDRRPIVINQNPFIAFKDDPKPEYNDQLIRASNFIFSTMRFFKSYHANILEPEVFHLNPKKSDTPGFRRFVRWLPKSISWYGAYLYKAFPLDMSHFPQLFNTTRIPRPEKDELYTNDAARHLAVLRNGRFYVFDVLNQEGNISPATDIMAHLKYILSDKTPPPECPLPVLTTEHRDIWTPLREHLTNLGNNSELFEKLDSAVLLLCLDDDAPSDMVKMARSFWHGSGSDRWFDKSISLIVKPDGKTSVNFEHAWGDGVAVMRYFNEMYKETTEKPWVHPDTIPSNVDSSSAVQTLEFVCDDKVKDAVKIAQTKFDDWLAILNNKFLRYNLFGRDFLKTKKFSPDSFLQLSFQMAFYRQYGEMVGTYESCSTSAFKHGRTETLRPATTATTKACEMFQRRTGVQPSVSELKAALYVCSEVHSKNTKDAAMGQGFDRHMFGMRTMAEARSNTLPDIYLDPAYIKINHITISTSTLMSPATLIGGFGPAVRDGFGIAYASDDSQMGLNVSCYPERNLDDFLNGVRQSFDEMHAILNDNDFRK